MNAFDFDNTIYRGESPVDFALFLIKHNKRIILYLPTIVYNSIKYKLCWVSIEKWEKKINAFLRTFSLSKEELLQLVKQFWAVNHHKLDKRMLKRIREDDIIITAGPSFLIEGIREYLKTERILGTDIDLDRKKLLYYNLGSNKVKRFRQLYGKQRIHCFYTDSFNDRAFMDISDRVYIVKKGRVKRIK